MLRAAIMPINIVYFTLSVDYAVIYAECHLYWVLQLWSLCPVCWVSFCWVSFILSVAIMLSVIYANCRKLCLRSFMQSVASMLSVVVLSVAIVLSVIYAECSNYAKCHLYWVLQLWSLCSALQKSPLFWVSFCWVSFIPSVAIMLSALCWV
jgi:hypothetical protein